MKRKYEKRDAVSYILLISKIQILASSYFNGLIILWDTLLMEQRKVYRDHKTVFKKIYYFYFN
jgi:TM2 domain-containing membrane protein YozV